MEFGKACNEVEFILEHLNSEDKEKIPKKLFQFLKENKDIFYEVHLDTSIPLGEQNLKEETKAFLQIIKEDYFSNNSSIRENIEVSNIKIDENNSINEFDFKDEIENEITNNNCKNQNMINNNDLNFENDNSNKKEMVVYKKSFFKNVIDKIKEFLKLKL